MDVIEILVGLFRGTCIVFFWGFVIFSVFEVIYLFVRAHESTDLSTTENRVVVYWFAILVGILIGAAGRFAA